MDASALILKSAGNNQETLRTNSNDIVTQRALREIYLKGFEIAVKRARPWCIMTSYNDINGVPAANNYDLCTAIAREEWGFDGFIMTDWGGGISSPAISLWIARIVSRVAASGWRCSMPTHLRNSPAPAARPRLNRLPLSSSIVAANIAISAG